ncbi:unnamed protein product [Lota lota]
MLVKVRFGSSQKYVKVAETEGGYEDYNTFIQKVIGKLGLPVQTELHLTDKSGTEVDADVFEELLQAGDLTINVSTERSTEISFESNVSDTLSSVPSDSSDATIILEKDRGMKRTHADRESAEAMVRDILQSKPGGEKVLHEYDKTKTLTDGTRRHMINLLVADMIEVHGRIPPTYVRTNYAPGIITLFPYLRDPYSKNGYEHFYDADSGSGYLAWRIKTVQRTTAVQSRRCSTTTTYKDGPKSKRDFLLTDKQLRGNLYIEAYNR